MARCEMAPFPLTVLLAFILSFTFVSTLSDKERVQLADIKQLLLRLQNDIHRIENTDTERHMTQRPSVRNSTDGDVIVVNNNDNKTETSFETSDNRTDDDIRNTTTPFENPTTQLPKTEWDTTASDSTTKVFDSTTVSSDLSNSGNRSGLDLTTGPSQTAHPDGVHSTGPSRPEVTEEIQETTTEEKKDKDKDVKDKEGHEETEEEENELREVENVRRLIDEGEVLERELKGVFSKLRSLNNCAPLSEKCGIREMSKCCKGLKCTDTWSGTCYLDCIPHGKSCRENFFCCPPYRCDKSFNRDAEDTYICQ